MRYDPIVHDPCWSDLGIDDSPHPKNIAHGNPCGSNGSSRKDLPHEYIKTQVDLDRVKIFRKSFGRAYMMVKASSPEVFFFLIFIVFYWASHEWEPRGSHEVGHAVFSPPISADEAIDWRVYEIDSSKIGPTNFVGNVIDLGSKVNGNKLQS